MVVTLLGPVCGLQLRCGTRPGARGRGRRGRGRGASCVVPYRLPGGGQLQLQCTTSFTPHNQSLPRALIGAPLCPIRSAVLMSPPPDHLAPLPGTWTP